MKQPQTKTSAKKNLINLPGVTAIKGVKNQTRDSIYLRSTEMSRGFEVSGKWSAAVDIWIPHCRKSQDFEAHHLRIEIPRGQTKFVMWQSKPPRGGDFDKIFCHPGSRYEWPADYVLGVEGADGDRYMTIRADGKVELDRLSPLRGQPKTKPKRTTKSKAKARQPAKKVRHELERA
jgi:hypothetical protein